jgi:hypothetical protein
MANFLLHALTIPVACKFTRVWTGHRRQPGDDLVDIIFDASLYRPPGCECYYLSLPSLAFIDLAVIQDIFFQDNRIWFQYGGQSRDRRAVLTDCRTKRYTSFLLTDCRAVLPCRSV